MIFLPRGILAWGPKGFRVELYTINREFSMFKTHYYLICGGAGRDLKR